MSNKIPSPRPLSRRRYYAYLAVTALVPVVILLLVELGFRFARPDGGLPLFEQARFVRGDMLVASRGVGQRWFGPGDDAPAPPAEPFARVKPDRSFRIFVLGESTTAGFPYPRNVTFSRMLGDALRDVLPDDTVEVINLGIAATNSFAMLDMAGEILAQRPDAILIYAGHNEYYGALGAASRVAVPGGTSVARAYLKLLRLRSVLALRNALTRARGGAASPDRLEAASLMEVLGRDRQVPLEGDRYRAGLRQFESNLRALVASFAGHGVPVFVGSLFSNLRDQAPFAADANGRAGGAVPAFDSGRAALGRGDSVGAARLLARARDLDVVRFRAPGEFNEVIRRVARSTGATYVPVGETLAAASRWGIPGSDLVLEHVHPNRDGYALIARAFLDALAASRRLPSAADTARLKPWSDYAGAAGLTRFDELIALHTVRALAGRWPFVPADRQTDYRGSYVPTDLRDSLAFAVSRGASWERAKLQLAASYEGRAQFDSAAAEYAGLARDAPRFADPLILLARALAKAGKTAEAEAALRKAMSIEPNPAVLAELGKAAITRKDVREGISLFERSLALNPGQPDVLFQLSLSYAMVNDLSNARAAAIQLARISRAYPGLSEWLHSLGVQR